MDADFWACAQVHRAGLAIKCLEESGHTVYGPRLRVVRTIRGRTVARTPLLFGSDVCGYIFVLVVRGQFWQIKYSPGVSSLLATSNGIPTKVPDALISDLRSREQGGLIVLPLPPKLRPGQRVRIVRGAFRGHAALYETMTGPQRIAVLMELLGREVRVQLAENDVEPLRPGAEG